MDAPHFDPDRERRLRDAETAVLAEVQRSIPKEWRLPTFQIDVSVNREDGSHRIAHRLWDAMTDAEMFTFSDALFAATAALDALMVSKNERLARGVIMFTPGPGGRRDIHMHFLKVNNGRGR